MSSVVRLRLAGAALAVTLPGLLGAAPATGQGYQRSYDAYDVRMNMLGIVDQLQRVTGTPFLDASTRASLQAVRAEIEAAPDADLERIVPVAPQLEQLRASLGMLASLDRLAEARPGAVRVSAGFGDALPGAAYPDLVGDVDNLITAVIDTANDFFDFRTDCIPALLLDAVVGETNLSFSVGVDVRDICDGDDVCIAAIEGALGTFGLCCGFSVDVNLDPVVSGLISAVLPANTSLQQCKDSFSLFSFAEVGNLDTGAADGLVTQLEGLGFQNLGRCDTDSRSATLAAFLTRTAEIMAIAARDIADKICNQDFGALVGFNLSVACIPIDVLNILAKGIDDNLALCDSFVDSAEINGTFVRMEALHDQVADAFDAIADVSADLAAHDAAVDAQLAANKQALSQAIDGAADDVLDALDMHDAEVNAQVDALRAALSTQLASHDTDIKTLLQANRTFFLGLELEEALIRRERDAVYYLPQAQGGHLEIARALVQQTIDRVAASGQATNGAAALLAEADAAIVGGQYKVAFDRLASAYFEAVKVLGENQPSPRSEP